MIKQRRSLRLQGHDYTCPGAYFITTFTKNRVSLFGHVDEGVMHVNENGSLVHQAWTDLPRHYHHIALDAFVVMPDHVHGIMIITTPHSAHGLPEIVRAFKSFSARRINERQGTPGQALWHRSFHERIIRDPQALANIRRYIGENPRHWDHKRWEPPGKGGSQTRPCPGQE